MALLAGGASAQLVRDNGAANAVQGFRTSGPIAGARLSASLPFTAFFQTGDGQAQLGGAAVNGNATVNQGAQTVVAVGVVRGDVPNVITGGGSSAYWPDNRPRYRTFEEYDQKPAQKRKNARKISDQVILTDDGPTVHTGIIETTPARDVLSELNRLTDEAARIAERERKKRLRAQALEEDEWLLMA